MIDSFLLIPAAAGIGVALAACPLGCFVVWRGMSYFGATLAHSALLGVALAFLTNIAPIAGVFVVGALLTPALLWLRRTNTLSIDTLLGILAHGTLALGLITISLIGTRVDLMAFLFGSILAVGMPELIAVAIAAPVILATLAIIWRPLLAQTVSADIAAAEQQSPARAELIFTLLIVAIIAIAMKIVGALLILSLLIIPAATARRFATTPERMAIIASIIGAVSVIAGIAASARWDTPTGPSIVMAATLAFLATTVLPALKQRKTPPPPIHTHDHHHGT